MIKSMTAFAAARNKSQNKCLGGSPIIQQQTSRYRVAYAAWLQRFEEKIKTLVNNVVERGRIEMSLQINDDADEAYKFEVNIPKARAYYDSLVQLKDQLELHADISIDLLIKKGAIFDLQKLIGTWKCLDRCKRLLG